ncbi:MAG TPA: methyl-accepting chemotaxis protein [Pseudobacteroides sp.]|uniref:methyl-accepting chemotaxis protein n=1 Tax=Pseudobacteroides sp. TaxID=1968840 RepID=UPI002F957ACF
MKWFHNLKISTKLLTGFIMVAIIAGVVGIVGAINMKNLDESNTLLYEKYTVPLNEVASIATLFQRIRVETRDLIIVNSKEEIAAITKTIEDLRKEIDAFSSEVEKTIVSKEFEKIFIEFVASRNEYSKHLDKLILLAEANKDSEAFNYLNGEMNKAAVAERDLIEKMSKMKVDAAKERSGNNTKQASSAIILMVVLIIVGMTLAVILGIIISRAISRPIKQTVVMLDEMKLGILNRRLRLGTKDEVGQMAAAMDEFASDLQNNVVGVMKKIAEGDVSVNVEPKDPQDEISPAIKKTIETIRGIISDTGSLIKSTQEGKLDTRGNAVVYSGSWRELVIGINSLIDAFVAPINVTADYLDRISKGDIPHKITDTYYGDFNEIKNNINTLIDNLNRFIEGMEYMSKQHDLGDIDVVVPEDKFEGAYKEMAKGVNAMVNGHITVMKKAMACLSEFGKGNFNAELEKFPGKKAFINENIEAMRKNLKDVNSEISKLIEASEEGRLSERGNDKAFAGDWASLIKGLNGLIDKIVEPILEAASVLDEMAKGNLQARVAGSYKGDHARIKEAMNFTLSTIAGYINEISSVLTEMANGNLNVTMSANYLGDFIEIRDSLNNIIISLNDVLGQMNNAAEQVAAGSRQVSESSQALSQGSTEQASSIEELTASMAEIAEQTKQNALNANQANDLAICAKDNAVQGNERMKGMLRSMEEINLASANISKIIKVIDEIAFQTNILALNAAVEAARAGQHGKGFAVVAEEVRNLAARSANAAKETTSLIEGTVRKVEDGTTIANDTAGALNLIVEGVTRATMLVGDIAKASNEQAIGISQVNQGISQVSQVTQSNSATAEESAAASEELSSQAEILNEMVSRFKLRKSNAIIGLEVNNDNAMAQEHHLKKKQQKNTKHKAETSAGKLNINLSDNDFGKY